MRVLIIIAQNTLIIELKSCTSLPHVRVHLFVTETQAESQVAAAWEVGAGEPEGCEQAWGRSVQFHHKGRKTHSEHTPHKEGVVASFAFRLGTEHVSLADRCLMTVLCNGNNDGEKKHFKTKSWLSKAGDFKMVRLASNTANASNISSRTFWGLNNNVHIKSSDFQKH